MRLLSTTFYFIILSLFISCKNTNKKVLIVHARGTSYSQLLIYLKQVEEGFFHKANKQKELHKLEPITNAVTISNIASFETGSLPSQHGIVGHNFGKYLDKQIHLVNGFSVRFEKETFWEKADKNGKSVLKLGALVLDGKYENHRNVDCIAQGSPTGSARIIKLIPSDRSTITKYNIHPPNPPLLLENSIPTKFYMPQSSTSVLLDNDYNEENGVLGELKLNEWLQVKENTQDRLTEAFKIKWVAKVNDTIMLYKRASFINRGYPKEFLEEMDFEAGPATGWPNIPFHSSKKISEETLVEEIFDEIGYVMKTFEVATKQKEYDLIYIDYPIMDRFGHGLMGGDPEVSNAMFDRMSTDFSRLQQFCQEYDYELIITSGHGFSSIHTSVDLNQFLIQNGIEANPRNESWEAVGINGKVSSHIYINPELSPTERRVLMNKISGRLRGLIDEKTKNSVVEEIVRKSDLNEVGLDNTNSGDLFVLLKPGYVFANGPQPTIYQPTTFKGDHGYSLKHEDSFGFVYSQQCDPCNTINIAQQVLETMGIN